MPNEAQILSEGLLENLTIILWKKKTKNFRRLKSMITKQINTLRYQKRRPLQKNLRPKVCGQLQFIIV